MTNELKKLIGLFASAFRTGRTIRFSFVVIALTITGLFSTSSESRCDNPMKPQRIENTAALNNFFESLNRTQSAATRIPTRILHFGDSHAAADLLTGKLRKNFQRDFGNAGPGFLFAGKPWQWYSPPETRLETSPGWNTIGLGANKYGALGISGICFETDRPNELIRVTTDADHLTIDVLDQPQGGEIEISIDGEIYVERERLFAPKNTASYFEFDLGPAIQHTVKIRTLTNQTVRLLGIVAEKTDQPGVTYSTLGINGARATRPLGWDWKIFSDNLVRYQPNLIVVAYGSNEIGDADLDLQEYQKAFSSLLQRFQNAASEVSILVLAPPDRAIFSNRKWQSIETMKKLIEVQREAALANGAAFWNQYQSMGGANSINRWALNNPPLAQGDRVHLTRTGYEFAADALYTELNVEYEKWKSTIRN